MTWGCLNQYSVIQLKLWELLTLRWLLLLSSPLLSGSVLPDHPLLWPLTSAWLMSWTSPPTSLHTVSPSLSCLPGDWVTKDSGEGGQTGLPSVAALSPFTFTSVYLSPVLYLSPFSRLSFPFLSFLFQTLGHFTPPCFPPSFLNTQCCSLFTLMYRFGPDGAGYVGGILMFVEGRGLNWSHRGAWQTDNREEGGSLYLIQTAKRLGVKLAEMLQR